MVAPARSQTLDKVSFGTNWVAEAEHGGFYQAVADGTYKEYGLDVTIVPGGPNENNRMLLIAGKIEFFMAANTLQSFDAVANNVELIKALPEPIHGLVTQAFSLSLHDTFLAAVPLTLLALGVALFLKEVPLAGRQASEAPVSASESGAPAVVGSSPTAV